MPQPEGAAPAPTAAEVQPVLNPSNPSNPAPGQVQSHGGKQLIYIWVFYNVWFLWNAIKLNNIQLNQRWTTQTPQQINK